MTDPITPALALLPEMKRQQLNRVCKHWEHKNDDIIIAALEALSYGKWVAVPRERLVSELKLLKRYQERGSDQSAKNWLIELGIYPLIGAK